MNWFQPNSHIFNNKLLFYFIFRGQAIKDLLKTIVIHPLTTAQKATTATISPAAQLLLSGADRGMFIVGAGEEEVIIISFQLCVQISELRSMQSDCLIYSYIFFSPHHYLNFFFNISLVAGFYQPWGCGLSLYEKKEDFAVTQRQNFAICGTRHFLSTVPTLYLVNNNSAHEFLYWRWND